MSYDDYKLNTYKVVWSNGDHTIREAMTPEAAGREALRWYRPSPLTRVVSIERVWDE